MEVILQDFDGSRTIYTTDSPGEVIHSMQTDLGYPVAKVYARTQDRDDAGRTIYVEQR